MFIRLLLFVVLIISSASSEAEVKVSVTVNDEVVSNIDIKREVQVLAATSSVEPTKENLERFSQQATDNLIDEVLFNKVAEELNINISEQEVQERLKRLTKSPELLNYIKNHGLNNDLLAKQIRLRITQEKVIAAEVIPYITISKNEVEDAKEGDKEITTLFELVRIEEGNDEYYLGLFTEPELNPKLRKILKTMRVGKISQNSSIKLLDRLEIMGSALNNKFDFVKISSDDVKNIKRILTKKDINCDNYFKKVNQINGLSVMRVKDFKADNTQLSNTMYKQLLTMKENDISPIINDNERQYCTLLLCNIISVPPKDEEIQEQIFRHKVAIQTEAYIKNLRKNNIINKNG